MNSNPSWCLTNVNGKHVVQIFQNDELQAKAIARYIKQGLLNDEAAIIFARPTLRKQVINQLLQTELDISSQRDIGKIRFFDAEYVLTCFFSDKKLDEAAFQKVIGIPIKQSQQKFGKVRVFGDIANVLWKKSEHDSAIELESLWSNLSHEIDYCFLCTYSLETLNSKSHDQSLALLSQYHKHLKPVQISLVDIEDIADALDKFGVAWNHAIDKLVNNEESPQTNLTRLIM